MITTFAIEEQFMRILVVVTQIVRRQNKSRRQKISSDGTNILALCARVRQDWESIIGHEFKVTPQDRYKMHSDYETKKFHFLLVPLLSISLKLFLQKDFNKQITTALFQEIIFEIEFPPFSRK
jgi:hypothetical protein